MGQDHMNGIFLLPNSDPKNEGHSHNKLVQVSGLLSIALHKWYNESTLNRTEKFRETQEGNQTWSRKIRNGRTQIKRKIVEKNSRMYILS